jgi:hypothetical protein
MIGRVPLTDLASGRRREEIARESSGSPPTGGEKNKQRSESVFRITPYTTEPGTSDISTNGSNMFDALRLDNLS